MRRIPTLVLAVVVASFAPSVLVGWAMGWPDLSPGGLMLALCVSAAWGMFLGNWGYERAVCERRG